MGGGLHTRARTNRLDRLHSAHKCRTRTWVTGGAECWILDTRLEDRHSGLGTWDSGLRTQDSGRSRGARVPGPTCFNSGSWVLSTLSPGFVVCGARPPVLPVPRPSSFGRSLRPVYVLCSVFCVLCFLLCVRASGVRFRRCVFCVLCSVFSILYSVLCVSSLVLPGPQCATFNIP